MLKHAILEMCPTAPEFKGMARSPLLCLCLSLPPLSGYVSQSVPKLEATGEGIVGAWDQVPGSP